MSTKQMKFAGAAHAELRHPGAPPSRAAHDIGGVRPHLCTQLHGITITRAAGRRHLRGGHLVVPRVCVADNNR